MQEKGVATQSMPYNGGTYKASTEETMRGIWVKTPAGWKVQYSEMLAYTAKGEWVQNAVAARRVSLHKVR